MPTATATPRARHERRAASGDRQPGGPAHRDRPGPRPGRGGRRGDSGQPRRRDVSQGQIREALASLPARRSPRAARPSADVNVFIGPPGVGKTTTIAKIAAQARARGERRFRLVAADGYRVGAVEQLRLYADIIGSPFVVARTPEEVTGAVDEQQAAGAGRHAGPVAGQRGSGGVLRGPGGAARRADAPRGARRHHRRVTSTASGTASRRRAPTAS